MFRGFLTFLAIFCENGLHSHESRGTELNIPWKEIRPSPEKALLASDVKFFLSFYEGKLVAAYEKVFRIQKGKKIPLESNLLKETVLEVSPQVLDLFPLKPSEKGIRSLKEICNQYADHSPFGMVWIDPKGTWHLLPDEETYKSHKKLTKNNNQPLILESQEWALLQMGPPIPSNTKLENILAPTVEILPLKVACRGLPTYVTYLDQIYIIERLPQSPEKDFCQRRPWDPPRFLLPQQPFLEISSSQAASIPLPLDLMENSLQRPKNGISP